MTLLIVHIQKTAIPKLLQALMPLVPPEAISLYEEIPISEKKDDVAPNQLVLEVVAAIRPKGNQTMRVEVLRAIFGGHDTFLDQGGKPDPALRNGVGALSKALKAVFNHGQPLRRLVVPKKNYFPGGAYKGTTYQLTALGEQVRDRLKVEGVLA